MDGEEKYQQLKGMISKWHDANMEALRIPSLNGSVHHNLKNENRVLIRILSYVKHTIEKAEPLRAPLMAAQMIKAAEDKIKK